MNKLSSILVLFVLLCATSLSAPLLAQSDLEALEDHMRDYLRKIDQKKDSAYSVLLKMDDEQTKTFRSLRKAYEKEQKLIDKKDRALVVEFSKTYDKLTSQSAADLGKRYFDIERERLALQEKYLNTMSDQISPVVAVQFVQLEHRFNTQVESERMKYAQLAE